MTNRKQRMDKLESNLTPKQAVLLWMEEAHQFATMEEYAQSLKGQPDSAWPLPRLGNQMETSMKRSMKGRPKEEINRALRRADLDVLFLFFLHQRVNGMLMEKDRYFATYHLMLAKGLSALAGEQRHNEQSMWNRMMVGLRLPYPLDPETAAAVNAAIEHHVITWEELEEGDEIDGWLINHYIAQGKTELPDGAYRLQQDYTGSSEAPDPEEVRELFADQDSFDKYLAGEDFSYGLADVTDEEFNARYETIVAAMKDLGLGGSVVELPSVPHVFLREAPLVAGEGIDRYVVELAEWGARLEKEGLVLKESDDPHAFAWFRITDPENGSEASPHVTAKLWRQTLTHLARFPGRTREIAGRLYLNWEDYLGWRGRWAKGNIASGLNPGLVASKWNQWVDEHGGEGEATLAGALVRKLSCHAQGYQYQVHHDVKELDGEQRRQQTLLESLWINKPHSKAEERFNERVRNWKELARSFLVGLYTLRLLIDTINRRYFEGQQVLFPKAAAAFDEMAGFIETLVGLYNRNPAEGLDRLVTMLPKDDPEKSDEPLFLDLSSMEMLAGNPAKHQTAYLVDMAKVEALDTIGENGKAVELLNRHV